MPRPTVNLLERCLIMLKYKLIYQIIVPFLAWINRPSLDAQLLLNPFTHVSFPDVLVRLQRPLFLFNLFLLGQRFMVRGVAAVGATGTAAARGFFNLFCFGGGAHVAPLTLYFRPGFSHSTGQCYTPVWSGGAALLLPTAT